MLPHLSDAERQETATMLESLSARSGSGPAPLVVQETGIIIPPVNFLNLPFCRYCIERFLKTVFDQYFVKLVFLIYIQPPGNTIDALFPGIR